MPGQNRGGDTIGPKSPDRVAKSSASGRFLFRPEKSSAGNFFVLGLQASQWAVAFYSLLFFTSSSHAWSRRTFCNAKMLGTLVWDMGLKGTNETWMPWVSFCVILLNHIFISQGFIWQAGDWQKRLGLGVPLFASQSTLLLAIGSPESYIICF